MDAKPERRVLSVTIERDARTACAGKRYPLSANASCWYSRSSVAGRALRMKSGIELAAIESPFELLAQ
jgi:hypothetical protein